jgi:hypothetical protein
MSFSRAILVTMLSKRYYNCHIFSFETRFRRAFASRLKNARRPKPLSCPPLSVETPVCGLIPRTPAPCCAPSPEGRWRGIQWSARNDLIGRRNWLPAVKFRRSGTACLKSWTKNLAVNESGQCRRNRHDEPLPGSPYPAAFDFPLLARPTQPTSARNQEIAQLNFRRFLDGF